MRLSVAGLRRFILATTSLLLFTSSVRCRDEILFTSSVSYCAPPIALLVQQFDITYFAANSSVFFNISASSVDPNINATANLLINVYGMQPINVTIDLCDQFGGALCPLPQYNFNGSEVLQLPSSIDVSSHVPGIAYKIPDLEAFAQLTLIDHASGEVKACVQSTLSNGWSTHQTGVVWATAGVALLALISAIIHSVRTPEALAPFRLVDLMSLYQVIGTSALLNLNYPVIYRSFASNFAWALGLVATGARSNIQQAINNMRHKTGGSIADANSGSAIDLVNRRFSPYNAIQPQISAEALGQVRTFSNTGTFSLGGNSYTAASSTLSYVKRDVATVTADSGNILQAGLPVYVNSLGIGTANGFMTVFFTVLFMVLIAGAVLGVGYIALKFLRRRGVGYSQKLEDLEEYYPWFARGWALRLILIAFLPVTVFTFYQWMLKDSWLSILLSVITFLSIASYLAYVSFRLVQMVRRDRPWTLYTHTPYIFPHGPLYIQYRHQRWYFFLFTLGAVIMRGIIVGFAESNGLAQVVLLLILELALLNATVFLKPHETRGGDVLTVTLAVARVIAAGLLFAFVPKFEVTPIPRVAIGIITAVLFSLMVILMFVNVVVNLGLKKAWRQRLRWRLGTRLGSSTKNPSGSRDLSSLEKGVDSQEKGTPFNDSPPDVTLTSVSSRGSGSGSVGSRPRNPTPLQNIPLDPSLNRPYPEITPTSASTDVSHMTASTVSPLPSSFLRTPTTASHASTFDSGLGSVLPRRQEFEGLGLDRLPTDDGELDISEHATTTESSSPSDETGEHFVSVPSSPAEVASSPVADQSVMRESWNARAAHLPMETISEHGHPSAL